MSTLSATTCALSGLTIGEDNLTVVWLKKRENVNLALSDILRSVFSHLETVSTLKQFVKYVESRPLHQTLHVVLSEEFFGKEALAKIDSMAQLYVYVNTVNDGDEFWRMQLRNNGKVVVAIPRG